MGYCIMRNEKVKTMQGCGGLEREHNREASSRGNFEEKFSPGINWEKTDQNIFLVRNNNWREKIKEKLKEHGIEKWRKDAVMLIDGLYTATPDVMKLWNKEKEAAYFQDCLKFHEHHYGVVVNAVVHYDETSPHLHINSVPLIQKDDGSWKLSAKEIFGDRKKMSQLQTEFYEEVGKKYGLHRGIEKSFKTHREVSRQLSERNEQLSLQLSGQAEEMEFQREVMRGNEKRISLQKETISKNDSIISDQRESIERQNIQIEKGNEIGKKLQKEINEKQQDMNNILSREMADKQYQQFMEMWKKEQQPSRWSQNVKMEMDMEEAFGRW